MSELSTGPGLCSPTHRLAFRPSRAAFDLGAGPDVVNTIFRALHGCNRRAPLSDYLGVALPGARRAQDRQAELIRAGNRGFGDLGEQTIVFGTPEALERLLQDPAIQRLHQREMILRLPRIAEVEHDAGDAGLALIRLRGIEARSSGAELRQARRDARRLERITEAKGRHPSAPKAQAPRRRDLFIVAGPGITLDIAVEHGPCQAGPVPVSSYGLSRAAAPSFLPVTPDTALP